jgi:hypothetical protein
MINNIFNWLEHFEKIGKDEEQFFDDLVAEKGSYNFTWQDIVDIYNQATGKNYSSSWAGKKAKKSRDIDVNLDEDVIKYIQSKQLCQNKEVPENHESFSDLDWKIVDLNVSKWNKSDERIQLNALYRRIAREISIKEMGKEIAQTVSESIKLSPVKILQNCDSEKEAILQISDWHYGVEVDSIYNQYNTEVARERIDKLKDEVFALLEKEDVSHLSVVNLGDLIAGRIHLQLRINSRIDVITQIIEVTELLAEMLNELSHFVTIDYYDTMDNHSRLEPNLKNSIELESLTRITRWYLEERLKDNNNIVIHTKNTYGDDIITFRVLGHEIAAVHGHKDKPITIIDNLSMMTKKHYDLILSSHLHHFSCDEKNETVLVSNSSLMGTDEFAQSLRLTSKPSQNLIILTKENPVYCIYKINL